MDVDRKALSRIKEILKANPRGMNVSEVAREIGMNRQSVAKYLEMMAMSGHVDVRAFGPSKVYYLSQRLPVSAMLSLSYDFIILLDRQLNVLNVNDRFIEFTGVGRDDILYKSVDHLAFPLQFEPSIMPNIKEALKGSESAIEAYYKKNDRESYFNIKFIPMVLDDGDKGITIIFEDITRRKRIEDAIRESEEKFRSVIEQAMDGIVLVDRRGTIVEYNRSLEEITGYARADVVGKLVWETPIFEQLFHGGEVSLEEQKRLIVQYIESGELPAKMTSEWKFSRRDGTFRYLQALAFKISSGKGNLLCAFVRDVTDRRQAEDAVAESEEKFRGVIEQSTDGIILSDERGVITKCNSAAERITGIGRQEMLGRQLWEAHLIILKNSPGVMKRLGDLPNKIDSYIKAPAPGHMNKIIEAEIHPPGMAPKTVQVNLYNIQTKKGIIVCTSIRDVTELKNAETALRESRERYRVLAETAEDFIYIIGRDLRVIYLNASGARSIGMRPEDVVGKQLSMLFPPEAYARMSGDLLRTFETGESISTELMIPLKNDKRWLNVLLTPIKEDGAVTSIMGISRDITRRKLMEEEMKRAQDELDRKVRERTADLEAEVEKRMRSEETLRESQRAPSALVGDLPGIVYQSDARKGWALEFISEGCQELTGYDPSELKGKTFGSSAILIHPGDIDAVKRSVKDSLCARKPFRIKYRIVTATGGQKWVLEQGRGAYDANGKLAHVDGFISDITEVVSMEEALRKSEEKYRSLVESVSDGVWETGRDNKLMYLSPRMLRMIGYEPGQLLGRTLYDLMSPEEAERVRIVMGPAETARKPFSLVEFDALSAQGRRMTIEISGDPIVDERGEFQGYRGIARDISRRGPGRK